MPKPFPQKSTDFPSLAFHRPRSSQSNTSPTQRPSHTTSVSAPKVVTNSSYYTALRRFSRALLSCRFYFRPHRPAWALFITPTSTRTRYSAARTARRISRATMRSFRGYVPLRRTSTISSSLLLSCPRSSTLETLALQLSKFHTLLPNPAFRHLCKVST